MVEQSDTSFQIDTPTAFEERTNEKRELMREAEDLRCKTEMEK
jgi:hypothetical protein